MSNPDRSERAAAIEREKAQLSAMTPGALKYLRRFQCCLCDHPIDHAGCSSIYGPPCNAETRIDRRARCLHGYKPRKTPNTKFTGPRVGHRSNDE